MMSWVQKSVTLRRKDDQLLNNHFDLLSLMIDASDNASLEERMNDQQIAKAGGAAIIGGYDSTGRALATAIAYISENPEVEAKLLEEIDRIPSGSPPDAYKYVSGVIDESMRMRSISGLAGRAAEADVILCGKYLVPKGAIVILSLDALHHNPAFWKDPEEFIPERFIDLSTENASRITFNFLPFGFGPHKCIGYRFALQEIKLMMIRLYSTYTFKLDKSKTRFPFPSTFNIIEHYLDDVYVFINERRIRQSI